MTFDEYQQAAWRTQNKKLTREELRNHALFGLAAECGEIHSLFQKVYQGHELNMDSVVKEMGDLQWFLNELADALGLRMDDIVTANNEKLWKRYPEGFDAVRSVHRTE